jgi:hypothetical protein
MKKKQFESLCKILLRDLAGFACKGWMLYSIPLQHLLRGFCCDTSGFDPAKFTVYVFVLPLYVPTNHLYFLFGERLKDDRACDMWWDVNDPNLGRDLLFRIRSQGIPYLNQIESPRNLLETADKLPATLPYKWETIAYSLAMLGEYAAAHSALNQLTNVLDVKVGWQGEMLDRAKQLGEKLKSDPPIAKKLLAEWEQLTLRNLGLRQ